MNRKKELEMQIDELERDIKLGRFFFPWRAERELENMKKELKNLK